MTPARGIRKLTVAQRAANDRTFRIFRLRGFWQQMGILDMPFRAMAEQAIDDQLASLGAERECIREQQRRLVVDDACDFEEVK